MKKMATIFNELPRWSFILSGLLVTNTTWATYKQHLCYKKSHGFIVSFRLALLCGADFLLWFHLLLWHCMLVQSQEEEGPDKQLINSVYMDSSSMELY